MALFGEEFRQQNTSSLNQAKTLQEVAIDLKFSSLNSRLNMSNQWTLDILKKRYYQIENPTQQDIDILNDALDFLAKMAQIAALQGE